MLPRLKSIAGSEEARKKNRLSHLGHRWKESSKRKVSRSLKGKPKPRKSRAKYSAASLKLWSDPEHRRKMREASKHNWKDPIYRKRIKRGLTKEARNKMSRASRRMQRERFKKFGTHVLGKSRLG